MFATSERSFGRSLLFLKDQIKDLKTSDRDLGRDAGSLAQEINALDDALSVKRSQRLGAVTSSPQAQVFGKLAALTKEFVDVELRLAKVQQYEVEQKKFDRLLDRREQAAAAVAQFRPARGKSASPIDDARQMLGDAMERWLVTWEQRTPSLPLSMRTLSCMSMVPSSPQPRTKAVAPGPASCWLFTPPCWKSRSPAEEIILAGCFSTPPSNTSSAKRTSMPTPTISPFWPQSTLSVSRWCSRLRTSRPRFRLVMKSGFRVLQRLTTNRDS